MVIAKVAIPPRDAAGIETVCLVGWLVGWQTSSLSQAFLYLSLWEHHSKYKNLFLLGKAGAPCTSSEGLLTSLSLESGLHNTVKYDLLFYFPL